MEVDNNVILVSKLVKEGHKFLSNKGTATATNAVSAFLFINFFLNTLKYFIIAASTEVTERGDLDAMARHPLKAAVVYL
jgi:hypothetical protein